MELSPPPLTRRVKKNATWPSRTLPEGGDLATFANGWGNETNAQAQLCAGRFVWKPDLTTLGRNERADRNSFHRAMRPVLVIAQCFTVMPVVGIGAPNAASLRFQWLSFRVLYSLVGISCVFLLTTFWTYVLFESGFQFSYVSAVVFYGTTLVNMIIFVKMAMDWPNLMMEVQELELSLESQYGYSPNYSWNVKALTALVLSAALIEHMLSLLRTIINAIHCSNETISWVNLYFMNFYGLIFQYVAYSPWIGIALFLTDNIATFAWNYMDLFVILTSIMLTQRFRQVNKRIKSVVNEVLPKRYWRGLREDFATLSGMVAVIDAHISKIVLLSFWNNLYFVCLQLYYSIKSKRSFEDALYFYSSFGYLLARFIAVCMCAAAVNDESKEPISVLYSVPSESYCGEVQRFISQATSEQIALTALNFFSLTRTLLLTVAGTIVTYEMIMVQLSANDEDPVANVTVMVNETVKPYCSG